MRTRNVLGAKRKDISLGLESNPIPVECPADVPLPSFNYIKRHSYMNSTSQSSHPPIERKAIKCQCIECDENCECMREGEKQNEIIECGDNCGCDDDCKNRRIANAVLPKIVLRYIDSTFGFGVFAAEFIKKGTFAGAYVGEVKELNKSSDRKQSDYCFSLYSFVARRECEIDATFNGNITRFYNHCCKPTLKNKNVYFGRNKWIYPVFFARKNIKCGEQLTIDYGPEYFPNKNVQCKCKYCT